MSASMSPAISETSVVLPDAGIADDADELVSRMARSMSRSTGSRRSQHLRLPLTRESSC